MINLFGGAGVARGLWVEEQWQSRVSWTLALLFVGVALGYMNAWHRVKQESWSDDDESGP